MRTPESSGTAGSPCPETRDAVQHRLDGATDAVAAGEMPTLEGVPGTEVVEATLDGGANSVSGSTSTR